MTDENMDARLRAAGERWRTANTVTADPVDRPIIQVQLAPPPRSGHRWLTALSAAVVAAALVVGGFFVFRHDDSGPSGTNAASHLDGIEWTVAGSNVVVTFGATTMLIGVKSCRPEPHRLRIAGNRMIIGPMTPGKAILCPNSAVQPDESLVRLERITWGKTTWSLRDGRLTLSNPEVGSVVLVRPGAALIGKTWQFVSLSMSGLGQRPIDTGSLHIVDDGRISWTGDCGTYDANVALTASTIAITDVHGGSPTCANISSAVAARLSGTLGYLLKGDQLVLTKPGEYELVLTTTKSRTSNDVAQLSAHPWLLDGTEVTTTGPNSGGGSGHSAITLSRLSFDGHGHFTLQHRCYTDTGTAQLNTGTATLAGVHLKSALPCASNAETPQGQKENDFVDTLLKGQVEWSIKSGELTITKGGTSATFSAR